MNVMRKIYNLLPRSVRSNIFLETIITVNNYQERNLPKNLFDLEDDNIKNCKILLNRKIMLEHLPSKSVVAAIGINVGDFAIDIYNYANPIEFFLINLKNQDFEMFSESLISKASNVNNIRMYQKDPLIILKDFNNNYFDWVYIDSGQDFNTVKEELEILKEKVKVNGFICGHNYMKGRWKHWTRYRIIEAVNDFCVRNSYEFIYFVLDRDQCFSYALRKM